MARGAAAAQWLEPMCLACKRPQVLSLESPVKAEEKGCRLMTPGDLIKAALCVQRAARKVVSTGMHEKTLGMLYPLGTSSEADRLQFLSLASLLKRFTGGRCQSKTMRQ